VAISQLTPSHDTFRSRSASLRRSAAGAWHPVQIRRRTPFSAVRLPVGHPERSDPPSPGRGPRSATFDRCPDGIRCRPRYARVGRSSPGGGERRPPIGEGSGQDQYVPSTHAALRGVEWRRPPRVGMEQFSPEIRYLSMCKWVVGVGWQAEILYRISLTAYLIGKTRSRALESEAEMLQRDGPYHQDD